MKINSVSLYEYLKLNAIVVIKWLVCEPKRAYK